MVAATLHDKNIHALLTTINDTQKDNILSETDSFISKKGSLETQDGKTLTVFTEKEKFNPYDRSNQELLFLTVIKGDKLTPREVEHLEGEFIEINHQPVFIHTYKNKTESLDAMSCLPMSYLFDKNMLKKPEMEIALARHLLKTIEDNLQVKLTDIQ